MQGVSGGITFYNEVRNEKEDNPGKKLQNSYWVDLVLGHQEGDQIILMIF
jgi:hypothetical protein